MNLESPKATIDKSAEDVFHFLSDIKNFKNLMPENMIKFEVKDSTTFLFTLKGMPEIILTKKEEVPHSKIVFGAAGGKLDFLLTARITEIATNKSEVQLFFTGQFNAMMAMMVKGPINKFIETLTSNLKIAF